MKKLFIHVLFILISFNLSGCQGLSRAIKHSKLDIMTKMSDTIFLDPISQEKKTVFVQVRNTSGCNKLDIKSDVVHSLVCKGYDVVNDMNKANYMMQINVLQIGKSNAENPFSILTAGYGGAIAGGLIGGVTTSNKSLSGLSLATSIVTGGVIGGIASSIFDAATSIVQYVVVTDIQVSQRLHNKKIKETTKSYVKQGKNSTVHSSYTQDVEWKRYQTRVVSVAKKVNLKLAKALPEIKENLVYSITGILAVE